MTEPLQRALARIRLLPPETQDEYARILLSLVDDAEEPVFLTPEEQAGLAASVAAADRGEFATDEEVQDVWARHGL